MTNLIRPGRRDVILGGAAIAGLRCFPASPARRRDWRPRTIFSPQRRSSLRRWSRTSSRPRRFPGMDRSGGVGITFGASGYTKPGLRLEQMNATEKAAAWDLLSVMWSRSGLEKARNVMLLQEILAQSGDAPTQRSPERFSFSIFGQPAEQGAWGLRFEGHHLTQSMAIRDNRIVSVTPFSFSVRPARIASGKHAGLKTIKDEEQLARRLFGDLSAAQQRKARIGDTSPFNILSYAGRERANAGKVGLAAAEMSQAQRDLLWQLVEVYSIDHLPAALTAAQRGRIQLRRQGGCALRLVRSQHAGEVVRLPADRRRLRDRAHVGRSRGAASAHDLPRPGERARPRVSLMTQGSAPRAPSCRARPRCNSRAAPAPPRCPRGRWPFRSRRNRRRTAWSCSSSATAKRCTAFSCGSVSPGSRPARMASICSCVSPAALPALMCACLTYSPSQCCAITRMPISTSRVGERGALVEEGADVLHAARDGRRMNPDLVGAEDAAAPGDQLVEHRLLFTGQFVGRNFKRAIHEIVPDVSPALKA